MCRERAAKRPQDFGVKAEIAGAALQPFRDTRPLLQWMCKPTQRCTGYAVVYFICSMAKLEVMFESPSVLVISCL